MKAIASKIKEVVEVFGEPGILLSCSQSQQFIYGKFFLAFSEETGDILPTALYLYEANKNGSLFSGVIPKNWLPGTSLNVRGPLGNGFNRSSQSRRVALAALPGANIIPLLALAKAVLQDHAEVVLLMDSPPTLLAPEIEVLPLTAIQDTMSWADAFFVVTLLESINESLGLFGSGLQLIKHAEIMVQTGFVCGGIASCGVCGVLTKKGWRLACKAGPVFPLKDLEYED